jgi:hypothetical protein
MKESREQKSILNARVNLIFYFITLALSFFTRKIFLDCLGADFVGLTSTIGNLLSFLNLAELGVGSAIGYVLYKPIYNNNHNEINEIISVFGYIYRKIGIIILAVGLVLGCFIPFIFSKTSFSLSIIYFAYFSFLASSLISYFINYRETLLSADQKNYVIVGYLQTSLVIKSLVQMLLAYYTKNYYYWISIELAFGFLFSIVLNKKINHTYPWLSTNIKKGKILFKQYPDVMKFTKQLFVHKIATFVLSQTSPFLVFAFSSLKSVAFYSNYTLITDKLSGLINNILGSTGGGVGNLIAEGDRKKIEKVFWELTSIRYYIAGIFIFSLYHLIEPFISLWLGGNYIMNKSILILILANSFILQTRGTNDQYIYGFGLFSDIWAPLTEAVLNLSIAIICGSFWGIEGVLMGPLISMTLIVCIWKPYFLYYKGFKTSSWSYWLTLSKYLLIIISSWILCHIILKSTITINPTSSYKSWIIYAIITTFVYSIISFTVMYAFTQGIRDFSNRMIKKIKK